MNAKLIGLLSVVALFTGVGCSEPPATSNASAAKQGVTVKNAHAFRAAASAETKAKLGITTWHLMTQPEANGIVVDGADANGVVKFSTVLRQTKGGKDLHIESYKENAGEFSLVKQANGDYVISNTIDMAAWMKVSQAFSADWKKGRSVQEYGYWGDKLAQAADIADKVSKVTGALGKIAKYIPLPQAQAASRVLTATSVAAGRAASALDKASKVVGAAEALKEAYDKRQDAKQDAQQDAELQKEEEQQKAEDEKQDAEQDAELQKEEDDQKAADEKQDAEQDAELQKEEDAQQNPDGEKKEDGAEGVPVASADTETETASADADNGNDIGAADAAESSEGQGDALTADAMDQDLDQESAAEGAGEEGASSEGAGEESSAGAEASGGGEETGASEFALHSRCRKLSCSKQTKACICKKY